MKRKILTTILSLVCVSCALSLVACGGGGHTHEWAQTWENNETHHWHNCTADGCFITDISDNYGYAEHDFSDGDCVCGYMPTYNYTVGLEYNFDFGTDSYFIKGIGTATDNDIVIPSEYEEKTVTKIEDRAFENCENITSITLPDSITVIGRNAFAGCGSLTSISIPDGVTVIEEETFNGCSNITSIVIPNSVTTIRQTAFEGCSLLTSINIPNSVTHIGWNAFENCINLTSINLPDGIPYISDATFNGCTSLASITIPNSVTSIGNNAFNGCSKLTDVTIPEAVTRLGNNVFRGCSSLTNIVIPSGVNKLYFSAFSGCSSLINLTVQGSETVIDGDTVFEGCPIETATIPARVCSYINNAALKTVVVTSGDRIYDAALKDCANLESITLPATVSYIGDESFMDCRKLTNKTFGGTKEQWYSIQVGSNWSYRTGEIIVHCTNGEVDYN